MPENKSNHTPGPWNLGELHVDRGNILIQSLKDYVAEVILYKESNRFSKKNDGIYLRLGELITEEESRANARLIVKAPKLLELIEQVLESEECVCESIDGICLSCSISELLEEIYNE